MTVSFSGIWLFKFIIQGLQSSCNINTVVKRKKIEKFFWVTWVFGMGGINGDYSNVPHRKLTNINNNKNVSGHWKILTNCFSDTKFGGQKALLKMHSLKYIVTVFEKDATNAHCH